MRGARGGLVPAVLLITACSQATQEASGIPPLLTELPRALSSGESRLVTAGNQLAFDLLREAQRDQPAGNIFLSPTSAAMALAMTRNGAAGTTRDSMERALRLTGIPDADINSGYRSLIDLLRGLDRRAEFAIANSIWTDAGVSFAPAFLEAARTGFDAEIRSVDFRAPATLDAINEWVKAGTGGKIPTILDAIAPEEVMFLINAIYFKGAWRSAFDPAKTRPAPFRAADGSVREVPTMHLDPGPILAGQVSGHQIVELLYGNGAFAMTLVLPAEGSTPAEISSGLDAARWAEWIAALHEVKLGLSLPRFRLEYRRELEDDLSALGMRIAFDPDHADFSRMRSGGQGNLFLTRVVQKTFVDVNEEGTTAAAATAVGVGVTSLPATIAFDRPFLFAIRERLTGTILFVGQIGELGG